MAQAMYDRILRLPNVFLDELPPASLKSGNEDKKIQVRTVRVRPRK